MDKKEWWIEYLRLRWEECTLLLTENAAAKCMDKYWDEAANALFISPQNREAVCKALYPTWVNSDTWKKIARKKLIDTEMKCELCGTAKNLQVHHITYDHQFFEDQYPEDLAVLCNDCHKRVHSEDIIRKRQQKDGELARQKRAEMEELERKYKAELTEDEVIVYDNCKKALRESIEMMTSDNGDVLAEAMKMRCKAFSTLRSLENDVRMRHDPNYKPPEDPNGLPF